jgi:hypothetical protein
MVDPPAASTRSKRLPAGSAGDAPDRLTATGGRATPGRFLAFQRFIKTSDDRYPIFIRSEDRV